MMGIPSRQSSRLIFVALVDDETIQLLLKYVHPNKFGWTRGPPFRGIGIAARVAKVVSTSNACCHEPRVAQRWLRILNPAVNSQIKASLPVAANLNGPMSLGLTEETGWSEAKKLDVGVQNIFPVAGDLRGRPKEKTDEGRERCWEAIQSAR